jgi:hypothetical protein
MANRKPPFVHIARVPEQQTSAPHTSAGNILTRLRERLTGSSSLQAGSDLSAPGDSHWDAESKAGGINLQGR